MTRLDLLGTAGLLALAGGLFIGQPWPGVALMLGAAVADYFAGQRRAEDVAELEAKVRQQQEWLERLNKSVENLNRAAAFGGKP